MAETFARDPAYSGPYKFDSRVAGPINVDVFGVDSVQIVNTPAIFPAPVVVPFPPVRIIVTGERRTWIPVRANAPAGRYAATYISGAIDAYAAVTIERDHLLLENGDHLVTEGDHDRIVLEPSAPVIDPAPDWNRCYEGECSITNPLRGPTNRVWMRAGGQLYAVPEPMFSNLGYPTPEAAQLAAVNRRFVFYHPGGTIEIGYDGDDSVGPARGSILFEVQIVEAAATWVVAPNPTGPSATVRKGEENSPTPHIDGLSPGIHYVRLYADDGTTQDYVIWVWRTPPRNDHTGSVQFSAATRDVYRKDRYAMFGTPKPAPWELFPVRPPKAPGNKIGTPLLNRQYLEQQVKTSGNTSERPTTLGNLPKVPAQLSDEKF